jgi:hypothetical protein
MQTGRQVRVEDGSYKRCGASLEECSAAQV